MVLYMVITLLILDSTAKQQSDFVRREPYLFDADGRAFWKLKGYNDADEVLLQG